MQLTQGKNVPGYNGSYTKLWGWGEGGLDSINPAPDRDNFSAQVKAEMNFRVIQNAGKFVTS